MRGRPSLLTLIYLGIGVFVAANRNYLSGIDDIQALVEAALAVGLWPLVLLGVRMRF